MGGRVPRGEPKKLAPGWVGDYQVPAQTRSPQCHHRRSRMPVVPAPRGGWTWLRGVLVVGDRRTVGDPRTAVACAGQHGRPRQKTRETLPPCDSGRHPVHRARWYRVAATADGVPASRDGVRGLRPLGPQWGVAAHSRRAARPTAGAGRPTGPDRGDHRLADGTRRRHRAPIQPRLRWRQENERRQAAPRRGCERPAAHRRRHRRLDPRPRRRTPTPGRTARQLVHHRAGLGRRRSPRTVAHPGDTRLTLTMQIIKRLPGATGFHVRPRIWVVERRFAWINKHRRCARLRNQTRPPRSHGPPRHDHDMTRRLART